MDPCWLKMSNHNIVGCIFCWHTRQTPLNFNYKKGHSYHNTHLQNQHADLRNPNTGKSPLSHRGAKTYIYWDSILFFMLCVQMAVSVGMVSPYWRPGLTQNPWEKFYSGQIWRLTIKLRLDNWSLIVPTHSTFPYVRLHLKTVHKLAFSLHPLKITNFLYL